MHRCDQLRRIERFDDPAGRARFLALAFALLRALGREHQYRRVAISCFRAQRTDDRQRGRENEERESVKRGT